MVNYDFSSIGFTGTRKGMTPGQRDTLTHLLGKVQFRKVEEVHHGGAIGADAEFHFIVREVFSRTDVQVCIHPTAGRGAQQDLYVREDADCLRNGKMPWKRNCDIIDASQLIIATPFEEQLVPRFQGGTWSTFLNAARMRLPRILILPSGVYTALWEG